MDITTRAAVAAIMTIIEDIELPSIGGNPQFFNIFRWSGVVCGGVEVNLRTKVRAKRYASPADRLCRRLQPAPSPERPSLPESL